MEPIKPVGPYHARPAGTALYRQGLSAYKVYYVDIIGRPQPQRYEWDLCGRHRDSVLTALADVPVEGIGAVAAFPHITKVFRFAPSAETIMHVRGFWTPDFSPVDLQREEGYLEFACYAEALIAADEYRYWAEAGSVADYLQRWSDWSEAPIVDQSKLARHFAGEATNP
jgi:hypothetical protein